MSLPDKGEVGEGQMPSAPAVVSGDDVAMREEEADDITSIERVLEAGEPSDGGGVIGTELAPAFDLPVLIKLTELVEAGVGNAC